MVNFCVFLGVVDNGQSAFDGLTLGSQTANDLFPTQGPQVWNVNHIMGRSGIPFAHVCTSVGVGQIGATLCKLLRLKVYIKRGEGVKNLENMQT